MDSTRIVAGIEDKNVSGLKPYIIIEGRDRIQLRLTCGSELTFDEQTLRRALAVIETHRREFAGGGKVDETKDLTEENRVLRVGLHEKEGRLLDVENLLHDVQLLWCPWCGIDKGWTHAPQAWCGKSWPAGVSGSRRG